VEAGYGFIASALVIKTGTYMAISPEWNPPYAWLKKVIQFGISVIGIAGRELEYCAD
jgi:hypothetical protein